MYVMFEKKQKQKQKQKNDRIVNIDKEKYEINSLHVYSCYDFICKEIFVVRLSQNQYKSTVHSQFLLNNIIIKKNWWNALIWVTGHCNRAAVSRNRYGVEKTVDTHKILINEIQFYVCKIKKIHR
jgi:Cdc6-like AAA superfamily ATPase